MTQPGPDPGACIGVVGFDTRQARIDALRPEPVLCDLKDLRPAQDPELRHQGT